MTEEKNQNEAANSTTDPLTPVLVGIANMVREVAKTAGVKEETACSITLSYLNVVWMKSLTQRPTNNITPANNIIRM